MPRLSWRRDDGHHPPESVDDPAIDVDEASRLMSDLGFVVFRTPPGSESPDSCLMVAIHDVPTRRHFDTEVVSYWLTSADRGRLEVIDRSVKLPFSRSYSWGRIRLVDRVGARNSFVSFGGRLTGEEVGASARLLIFRSPAMILRLPGHSQYQDRLAEEALTFFGRVIPHLWSPDVERRLSAAPPLDLYAAFLLHTQSRLVRSSALRDAIGSEANVVQREIDVLARDPSQLEAARQLMFELGIQLP
jgi:hypothetical protein